MPVCLPFADSEHLGATLRAHALCCGLPVLHFDRLRVPDFHLGATLHTISLHVTLLSIVLANETSTQLLTCQ